MKDKDLEYLIKLCENNIAELQQGTPTTRWGEGFRDGQVDAYATILRALNAIKKLNVEEIQS
ncbi:MAG: hypothetical protein AB1330_01925 [Bacillota bacterium]